MTEAGEGRVAVPAPAPTTPERIDAPPPLPGSIGPIGHLARSSPERRRAGIEDLNARVGNRRVTEMIAAASGAAVARQAAIGLRQKGQVSGFATLAVDYWRANGNGSLTDFGAHLMDRLNVQLAANGVPKLPPPNLGAGRGAGGFRRASWTVDVDVARIAGRAAVTKLADLTVDQVAEVAGICFHEVRHAEQMFLVARLVASRDRSKDAKTLAAELDLEPAVAAAAVQSRDPLPDKQGIAQVEGWRAFSKGGRHEDYKDFNDNFSRFVQNTIASLPSKSPEGVDSVTAAWKAVTRTIASWKKDSLPFLDAKIAATKGAKSRDATDNRVLADVTKIRAGAQAVVKADTALADEVARFETQQAAIAAGKRRQLSLHDAKMIQLRFASLWLDLSVALLKLGDITNEAYRAYAHEADAYAAQAAVMKEIKARAKAPAAKPKVPAGVP